MNYQTDRSNYLNKSLSVIQNAANIIDRIEKNSFNAFITFDKNHLLTQAKIVQNELDAGIIKPLSGLFVAVKDNISVKDLKLTCASNILADFVSPYDATVVQRLKAAGAIIVGKTNMDEFAMGSSGRTSAFGQALNPINIEYSPGGSSSGSAVAVAAGFCHAALGSETGGSVRQPAAFCGIYGLKPTYGRVSRFGLVAFSSSFDCIGSFANDLSTLQLVNSVIAGFDANDSSSAEIPVDSTNEPFKPAGKKIAVLRSYLEHGTDPEIKNQIEKRVEFLKSNGAIIEDVEIKTTDFGVPAYYVLTPAEASANLARFDGVKYGLRVKSESLEELYFNSRSQGFGEEVRRRIMLGTFVLSSGFEHKYYQQAQKVRRLIKDEFDKIFSNYDLIIAPTTPTAAFKVNAKLTPVEMWNADIFTVAANIAGFPSMNIPMGLNSQNLPIGMQLMSRNFQETELFAAAEFMK